MRPTRPLLSCLLSFLAFSGFALASSGSRFGGEIGAPASQPRIASSLSVSTTCAVKDEGTVWCWGVNDSRLLGPATTAASSSTPVQITNLTGAISVALGGSFGCALIGSGGGASTVQCWGNNSSGQLGDGTTTTSAAPITVKNLSGVVQISAGLNHVCALRYDGTLRCWGGNATHALGDTDISNHLTPFTPAISGAIRISTTLSGTCALLVGGSVQCWGRAMNIFGGSAMGDGVTIESPSPVTVSGITTAVNITSGAQHNCALLLGGSVKCWGSNESGQLGLGNNIEKTLPVSVSISSVVALSGGLKHSCAIVVDGTVHCWGTNASSQLGTNASANYNQPGSAVSGLTDATEISAGVNYSCAIEVHGVPYCWGADDKGQLGNGITTPSLVLPSTVTSISGSIGARGVVSGGAFVCARRGNATLSCWGAGESGQMGNGSTISPGSRDAIAVTAIPNPLAIGTGKNHVCTVRTVGDLFCWGDGSGSQLGYASAKSTTPQAVFLANNPILAMSGGQLHSCAITIGSIVTCWGTSSSGQTGSGVNNIPSTDSVFAVNSAVAISSGISHTCAVLINGHVSCWGDNFYGQLGDNQAEQVAGFPVAVLGLTNVVAVAAGGFHTCALTANGLVYCWGENTNGQLGTSNTLQKLSPTLVNGLSDAIAITAGPNHTCALRAEHSAVCWGDNGAYQLGSAAFTNSNVPVPVISGFATVNNVQIPIKLANVRAISAGIFHTCALVGVAPYCWGDDTKDQIGLNPRAINAPRPTLINSFTANINPAVTISQNSRIATVNVILNCPDDARAHIILSLVQGQVQGGVEGSADCTGKFAQVPLNVPAHGLNGFQAGPATAQIEAIIRQKGDVIEDQHWTRAVQISVAPATSHGHGEAQGHNEAGDE
jgi:alpha-tubulin suppressor-like RCC1 family protein